MESKDLRIGNWFVDYFSHSEVETRQITSADIVVLEKIEKRNLNQDRFEPISLTEEWLLKFDIEKGSEDHPNYNNVWERNKFLIFVDTNGFDIHLDTGSGHYHILTGKYVHELQNFFALTDEELTIK